MARLTFSEKVRLSDSAFGLTRMRLRLLLVVVVVVGILSVAFPVSAGHVVEWSIGPDCEAEKLEVEASGPTTFSVCVGSGGSPFSGWQMTVQVVAADGTSETFEIETDANGEATFEVDIGDGQTQISLCDDDGCVYGQATITSSPPTTSAKTDSTTGTTVLSSSSSSSASSTTTTTMTPSTTDVPSTTEVTLPEGGNLEGGSFSIWIPIFGFGIFLGGFTIYFRTRERGRQPASVDEGDDDDGDDPRDTPPPVMYGEEIEQTGCGWALYWTDEWGVPQLIWGPGGLVHICCRYYLTVKTSAESAVVKQSLQYGSTERLRIYDAGRDLDDVRIEARAGARSGPAGRQDWMHGLGDPTDLTSMEAGEFRQQQPVENPPDVSARVEHWERTTLAVTLLAGCPEYTNLYLLEGVSDMTVMATHECTNDAGDPCPVELSATGDMSGSIEGPAKFGTVVSHELGGTPDDLDREQSSTEDLGAYKPRAGHDHAEKDRVTHEFSAHDKSTEAVETPHLNIVVRNQVQLDASQIVPEEVWPTTERVSAHLETMITHEVEVEASLKPEGCESNGCCGHGTCGCDAKFEVTLSRFGSALVVEDKVFEIVRIPKPPGVVEWETWELRPVT